MRTAVLHNIDQMDNLLVHHVTVHETLLYTTAEG